MSRHISWDDQRAFLAVLETGSLSAAARQLGLTQPTVRARIEALEAALGTTLFTRSVHGLKPTARGQTLEITARAMAHASDAFVRGASAEEDEISGAVRLSVSEFVGVAVLPAMLAPLADRHPALRIELELSNRPADLLEQQVDIAVRMTPPQHAALVAQRVPAIRIGLYAHVDYLAAHGTPASVEDLTRHRLVGPDRSRGELAMVADRLPGLDPAAFILRTDAHPVALGAARAGLGIAAIHRPLADADPCLRPVLPQLDLATLETWIVTHENLRKLARIDAVFDHLVQAFTAYGNGARLPPP